MKRYILLLRIAVVAVSVSCLSGCDFLRTLAGRPTSTEIEVKRAAVEQTLRQKALEDSLAMERLRQAADSLDALNYRDSLAQLVSVMAPVSKVPGIDGTQLQFRYYPMVGSFSEEANADRLVAAVGADGHNAVKLKYRKGRTAVSVGPSDNPRDIYKTLKEIKGQPYCPADVWLLINE